MTTLAFSTTFTRSWAARDQRNTPVNSASVTFGADSLGKSYSKRSWAIA